jgi:hypothetical protein
MSLTPPCSHLSDNTTFGIKLTVRILNELSNMTNLDRTGLKAMIQYGSEAQHLAFYLISKKGTARKSLIDSPSLQTVVYSRHA